MTMTPANKREKNSPFKFLDLRKNSDRVIPFIRYNILRDFRSFFSGLGIHLCNNDRQLASFKNIHKNDRCFILGNGPSLSIADLDRLQNEITFACNKIYLAFTETAWRPTYYAVEDDLVILQNHANINELSGFTKFFPERTKKLAPPFKNSLYFNLGLQKKYSDTPSFSNNALSKIYHGATIVYTMIQLACFMGFKEIFLLGVDFNFSFNNNTVKGTIIKSQGENNHFHPNYRTSGEKWHKPRLQDQERAFLVARKSTKKLNCEIFDATRNGKLTVFPKVTLDTILK